MVAMGHQLEIVESVIGLVSIEMVHVFIGSEGTTEVLFHDVTVLFNAGRLSIPPDFPVYVSLVSYPPCCCAVGWNLALAVVGPHTRAGTILSGASLGTEERPAVLTGIVRQFAVASPP